MQNRMLKSPKPRIHIKESCISYLYTISKDKKKDAFYIGGGVSLILSSFRTQLPF